MFFSSCRVYLSVRHVCLLVGDVRGTKRVGELFAEEQFL